MGKIKNDCIIGSYTQKEIDHLKKHWCSLHNHTGISNASRGFIDSSIKLENLVDYSMEKGLNGIALTDHESVGGFIQAEQLEKEKDFPILRGDEIYLVSDKQYDVLKNDYKSGMYFPHFLLVALDKTGNEILRRLSTKAWVDNSFWSGGLLRTPTKMSDLQMMIGQDKGHIVASTACLGGQLSKWIVDKIESPELTQQRDYFIQYFIQWCLEVFGDNNFFLEMQPSDKYRYSTIVNNKDKRIEYEELLEILKENPEFQYKKELEMQYVVNQELIKLSKQYNIPMIITTDTHYLKKEHLKLHSAFLNSSGGNDEDYSRNVEEIYRTTYVMSVEEILEYFKDYDKNIVKQAIINTGDIVARRQEYSLAQKQKVPKIKKCKGWDYQDCIGFFPNRGIYKDIMEQGHEDDRYLLYRLMLGIKQKPDVMSNLERSFIRLEEEIVEILAVSKQLEEHLGNYFTTMEKLIEIIWEKGDSIVGAGRGSCASSLIAYCLGITQCNPLLAPVEMPFWRFITRERAELPDIDIDTQSNRRLKIFNAVKRYFTKLGGDVVNCGTYGTVGSKSAIQIACRGLGYTSDIGMEISSFVPVERGEAWELSEVYYGNTEKNRKPIKEFVSLVDSYDGVMDLAFLIEGVINARGVHASGVFITNDDFCNYSAKMLSPKGILTSQWDLHASEYAGLLKYDFLTTDACTKIRQTMDLLIEYGHMERKNSLKETYHHYLNPMTMNYNTEEVWKTVGSNSMIDIFQFDTETGQQTIKDIQPTSWLEIAQSNSLMRLQKQEGAEESPAETFVRFKNDINKWYQEMEEWGVPKEDQQILSKVLEQYKGVADTQEAIMILSQLDEFAGFTVKQSHTLRKSIAKKSPKAYAEVEELFYAKCKENNVNTNTAKYIWEVQVSRQKGYSFSILHCLVYSLIALQELVLYTQYPSIYWNTAVLTVNAGAMEDSDEGDKKQSTSYGKIAKAIGEIQKKGVTVALPDINQAEYGFVPNESENAIIFALKGMSKISDDEAFAIVKNRPYKSMKDFYERMVLTKIEVKDKKGEVTNQSIVKPSAMINLIKGGAFDKLGNKPRIEIMEEYLKLVQPPREKLDTRATQTIVEMGIVPSGTEEYQKSLHFAIRIINLKNYVVHKGNYIGKDEERKTKKWYVLRGTDKASTDYTIRFFEKYFLPYMTEGKNYDYYYNDEGEIIFSAGLKSTGFMTIYGEYIKEFKEWINSEDCLNKYNYFKFMELWNKEANGSISKWEMDSLNYYYHEHEMANIDKEKYLVEDFSSLPEEPIIKAYGQYGKRKYPIYKLNRIAGTVIDKVAKDKMVYVLTTDGEVVGVKFYSGQFSFYDKNISEEKSDGSGKKTVIEESWFKRGNKLLITGYRRENQFIPKKYSGSAYQHTVTLVNEIRGKDLVLQFDRARV